MKRYFVTGIGTDVGKTFVSAILVEALGADYWKPLQAGLPSDADFIRAHTKARVHPEAYRLKDALSPHDAAAKAGVRIEPSKLIVPATQNTLVIEGIGGALVPLNDDVLVLDWAKSLEAKVILVSRNYLGSINHTLLTCEALAARRMEVAGIVFNGPTYPAGEELILRRTGLPCLFRILEESVITAKLIRSYAATLPKDFR